MIYLYTQEEWDAAKKKLKRAIIKNSPNMAKKEKGKTYEVKYESALGKKHTAIIHAPNKEAAKKVADVYYPNAGFVKVKRLVTQPGILVIMPEHQSLKGTQESTESMTLDKTFSTGKKEFDDEMAEID
jgi:hypothetical protein